MARPIGSAAELERRRKRAVQSVANGQPRATVPGVPGVHPNTVARWVRLSRQPGGLDARPLPGPTASLTDTDLRKLEGLLVKGAKAHGWPNELWTAARVARLIDRHFHLDYHPEHVRKILKRRLGWTSQKPHRQTRERDDKEVARWAADEFPRIVRQAYRRGAHLAFLDESGFMLNPTVRRTFAPEGQDPGAAGVGPPRPAVGHQLRHPQPGSGVAGAILRRVRPQRPRRGRGRLPGRPAPPARPSYGGVGPEQHP